MKHTAARLARQKDKEWKQKPPRLARQKDKHGMEAEMRPCYPGTKISREWEQTGSQASQAKR